MKMTRNKKRNGRRRKRRTTGRRRAWRTLARNGTLNVLHPTPTMKDKSPPPSTNPPSFPTNIARASWLRRRRYVHEIPPKYTSSSDEESDDDVDYIDHFKGLDRSKVDKINELIDALSEKDRLLEKQEDILYEEHNKFINVQKSLALETKNELLSSELSSCHDSISSLKSLNADLSARLEKVNVSSSSVEHVSICNRCKDFDIDACNAHASTILKLNNDVANLNTQLKTCKSGYEKLKFARDAYTIGRHPLLRLDLVSKREPRT
jgi:hypothetical protein